VECVGRQARQERVCGGSTICAGSKICGGGHKGVGYPFQGALGEGEMERGQAFGKNFTLPWKNDVIGRRRDQNFMQL